MTLWPTSGLFGLMVVCCARWTQPFPGGDSENAPSGTLLARNPTTTRSFVPTPVRGADCSAVVYEDSVTTSCVETGLAVSTPR